MTPRGVGHGGCFAKPDETPPDEIKRDTRTYSPFKIINQGFGVYVFLLVLPQFSPGVYYKNNLSSRGCVKGPPQRALRISQPGLPADTPEFWLTGGNPRRPQFTPRGEKRRDRGNATPFLWPATSSPPGATSGPGETIPPPPFPPPRTASPRKAPTFPPKTFKSRTQKPPPAKRARKEKS